MTELVVAICAAVGFVAAILIVGNIAGDRQKRMRTQTDLEARVRQLEEERSRHE